MSDYFEVDFLAVESKKSGDAITVRYELNGVTSIHVVDGGFTDTGQSVVEHINKYYNSPKIIDHVIVTHNDQDHAMGLRTVLESFVVRNLWILRPWKYASELLPRFPTYTSAARLESRLRSIYSNLAALEDIAHAKKIPMLEPFQGSKIGAFTSMSPSRNRFLDLVVNSERTPESEKSALDEAAKAMGKVLAKTIHFLKAAWGSETFSPEETSAENEMSVVQYANICGQKILLTGDTGRSGLAATADYAPSVGLVLPGIDRFQVPHHGSRRNVSSETLDRLIGPKLGAQLPTGQETFIAIVSSAKEDPDHPRKAVTRAMIHRGAKMLETEGVSIRTGQNAPPREGWVAATPVAYPEDTEE